MTKIAHIWFPVLLLAVACTPANKVAQEIDWVGTDETDSTSTSGEGTDTGADGDCNAGGGDQPCSAVTACEAGCRTNTFCLGDCRASLCTAHETIYCDMVDCISTYCGTLCDDLSATDCLLCIPIYCGASWGVCSAATSCTDDTDSVK